MSHLPILFHPSLVHSWGASLFPCPNADMGRSLFAFLSLFYIFSLHPYSDFQPFSSLQGQLILLCRTVVHLFSLFIADACDCWDHSILIIEAEVGVHGLGPLSYLGDMKFCLLFNLEKEKVLCKWKVREAGGNCMYIFAKKKSQP